MAGYVWLLRQTGADCGRPQKCFNFPMKIRNRTSGDLSDYQGERTAHRILKQRPSPTITRRRNKPIYP
jgi:hypothetical protein